MHERFFGHDASLSVGGVSINGEGRAEMWRTLLDHLQGHYLLGNGVGAAGNLIDRYFENLGHPHNDFLRFLYDFGIFGLGWWLIFKVVFIGTGIGMLRRCATPHAAARWGVDPRDFELHLAPLLALAAVIASMFSDNSVSYVFVMAPLAMLIGCSLSRVRAAPSRSLTLSPNGAGSAAAGPGAHGLATRIRRLAARRERQASLATPAVEGLGRTDAGLDAGLIVAGVDAGAPPGSAGPAIVTTARASEFNAGGGGGHAPAKL